MEEGSREAFSGKLTSYSGQWRPLYDSDQTVIVPAGKRRNTCPSGTQVVTAVRHVRDVLQKLNGPS